MLVVDDDPDIRRLINRALGSDYELVEASDGTRALQLAEAGDIDIVILDLKLPGSDPSLTGMRLLYRLHGTLGPVVPILVISGGDLTEVYETGMFRALPKPFTPLPLRKLVTDLLIIEGREAAAVVPGTSPVIRPWWMPPVGILLFIGALISQWKLAAPTTVWVPLAVLGVLLLWVGPAPADMATLLVKLFKKGDKT